MYVNVMICHDGQAMATLERKLMLVVGWVVRRLIFLDMESCCLLPTYSTEACEISILLRYDGEAATG
jgi:hypothetical protein